MPDANLADGDVLTSSFYNTYIREQLVTSCTSATHPTGVEGRLIYETDTDRYMKYDGTNWVDHVAGLIEFTPAWSFTVGNGVSDGVYAYLSSGLMFVQASFIFGSTSSVGSGMAMTLPDSKVCRSDIGGVIPVGVALIRDTGTGAYYGALRMPSPGSSQIEIIVNRSSGTYVDGVGVSSTIPMTWTTSDEINIHAIVPIA